jgi:hypothetical protein
MSGKSGRSSIDLKKTVWAHKTEAKMTNTSNITRRKFMKSMGALASGVVAASLTMR